MTTVSPTPGKQTELDALIALAMGQQRAGRLTEAAAVYEAILALRPDIVEAHNNLGVVLRHQGKLDEAASRFEQALALRPDYVDAYNNLGATLKQQGKFDQAVARFEQALVLRPDHAQSHNNLGNVLFAQGKLDEAAARYAQALALRPEYVEAHNNLGNVLLGQDKLAEAAACYERALALRPDHVEAHYNLGNVLMPQGRFEEAAARYERAVALRPDYAEALHNLAVALRNQGRLDEAVQRFEQAIALRPDYAEAQLALATCRLLAGDYERGWTAFEVRPHMPKVETGQRLPRWTGQPLARCRLLLIAEQGLGDTLQFMRYARVLKERGARIVLACQRPLARLLAHHPDLDELFILGSAEEWPRSDYYLPLLSAPAALLSVGTSIPCDVPYVWADPELTDHWRGELAAIDGFRIGIAWQGSSDYVGDRWRSIPLEQFAPLARLPGVRLVSLQKGFGSEQVATVDFPVLDLGGRLDEAAGAFVDTAAVIGNLDLVVTSDTAVAHLAGALGAPVWLAVQFSSEWRWMLGSDATPWYPTMRLFRQTTFGEWPDVFERIAAAVQTRRLDTAH